jgi:hypothetical protein
LLDTDADDLADGSEVAIYGTNPSSSDTEGDGMTDGYEVAYSCISPFVYDSNEDFDIDGLSNFAEFHQLSSPCIPDSDSDALLDSYDNCPTTSNPTQLNTDAAPLTPAGAADDTTIPMSDSLGDACDPDDDNDGLADDVELALAPGALFDDLCSSGTPASANTNPLLQDTDGDRVIDGAECALGSDPASAASKPPALPPGDSDGDGLTDAFEATIGSDPFDTDTDNDGITEGLEYRGYGTSPLATDSDLDGCPDGVEIADVNGDKAVNSGDLLAVALKFGAPGTAVHDVNRNGAVNSTDLLLIAGFFGQSCP